MLALSVMAAPLQLRLDNGFPWLSRRKSGIIYEIEEDAHYLAAVIVEQLA